jgi:Flp pilus assembly protein TadD
LYRDRFAAMQRRNQLTSQVDTLGNFALASANRGDFAQAIAQFHEALQQCGDCVSKPDLHKDLGLIECKSGDVANGAKDLRIAASLKPQDAEIKTALDIASRALEQQPH